MSKTSAKDSYLFQEYEKDNSQIQTKEGATGYPIASELSPRCVAMFANDSGTLEPQTLRYIEGETDLRLTKQRKEITKREEVKLLFKNGMMMVSKYEPLKLQYLLNHPQFEGNVNRNKNLPIRFKLINKEAVKKQELDKEKVLIQAKALVLDMFKNDIKGAEAFCLAVGVDTEQDAAMMEYDLLKRVRLNPDLFLKQLSDPTMKEKAFVRTAIREGVIKIKDNTITWGDGSATGFTSNMNDDIETSFIAWFETKEGKAILKQIKYRLENPKTQL